MKELRLEFRLGQAKLTQESKELLGWAMQTSGQIGDVRHDIRSAIGPNYPTRRQMLQFITRTTRQMQDWFDSPDYEEAQKRAEEKRRPPLILVPGRGA